MGEKIKEVPALIFPRGEEGDEAFLACLEAKEKYGMKFEFCPSQRGERPLLITENRKYVGSGEILDCIEKEKQR